MRVKARVRAFGKGDVGNDTLGDLESVARERASGVRFRSAAPTARRSGELAPAMEGL